MSSSNEHTCPMHGPFVGQPGCPFCNPNKTVPELNRMTHEHLTSKTLAKWPERIYLQRDYECAEEGCGPHSGDDGETTWCKDKIHDTDVEYVRADLARVSDEPNPVQPAELPECVYRTHVPDGVPWDQLSETAREGWRNWTRRFVRPAARPTEPPPATQHELEESLSHEGAKDNRILALEAALDWAMVAVFEHYTEGEAPPVPGAYEEIEQSRERIKAECERLAVTKAARCARVGCDNDAPFGGECPEHNGSFADETSACAEHELGEWCQVRFCRNCDHKEVR